MDTKILIGRFIGELPKGQVFITRELLTFGLRDTVDTCLWNMVQRGIILRLANGVFVRRDIGMKMPALAEIIKAKARAHVKRAIPLGVQLAKEHSLTPKPKRRVKNQKKILQRESGDPIVASCAVLGDTSRFNTVYGRVEFRSTPARKYFLSEGKASQILAAWWAAELGEDFDRLIDVHIGGLGKIEKKRFKEVGAWSPAWISDSLLDGPLRYSTQASRTIYPLGLNEEIGSSDSAPFVEESIRIYKIAI